MALPISARSAGAVPAEKEGERDFCKGAFHVSELT